MQLCTLHFFHVHYFIVLVNLHSKATPRREEGENWISHFMSTICGNDQLEMVLMQLQYRNSFRKNITKKRVLIYIVAAYHKSYFYCISVNVYIAK